MLRAMIAEISTRSARLAQIAWALTLLSALGFFLFEVGITRSFLQSASEEIAGNLSRLGISMPAYFAYLIGLRTAYLLIHVVIAGIIIFKRSNDRFAVFVSFFLVIIGSTFWPLREQMAATPEFWHTPRAFANLLASASMLIFILIIPDGRFYPRWVVLYAALMISLLVADNFFPSSWLSPQSWGPTLAAASSLLTILIMAGVPIYRYRKLSNPILRQQFKWVVFGLVAANISFFVVALPISFGAPTEQGTLYGLFLITGMMLSLLLIPLSIGVAILRFRLWDIDLLINRTLVYGVLSLLVVTFYILIVGGFAYYFQNNESNLVISFIATGIVAILFEPIRQRLQRAVNRLMYGEREDPATVLLRLSQRLDSALAPDSVLQTIVETLAQTLRLPYTAITLLDEEPRFASTPNLPPSELIQLPLTYQTERVGELILAPRAPGESFSSADMKLINLIAQQAGIAAYTLHLNNDLQKSRERLVTAQEEERRRLRRDLHDGVGPTLASLSQRIDTAADLVNTNPQASIDLLKDLKGQVKNTVAEIRRLVYALRPPVLDEFGLVTAIREHVAPYMGPNGLQITFDVTEPMPSLPAAIEVAAYRIALEAFTNIVNHAQAKSCHITMKMENNSLLLSISDNGIGISSNHRAGIGLTSMRERAAELGGEFIVENNPTGGTRVKARLPISERTATFMSPEQQD